MKSFFTRRIIQTSILFILILSSACSNQPGSDQLPGNIVNNPATMNEVPEGNYPVISFETLQFNFGKITEGDQVTHVFNFKNTGTANLVITDVRASCGCTSPSWPKEIIKPGETNSILVKYNSEGREGKFNKGVTVYCNAYPNSAVLRIEGEVIPKL